MEGDRLKRRDLNIELMELRAKQASKNFEFNSNMNELKRRMNKIDKTLGGMKHD